MPRNRRSNLQRNNQWTASAPIIHLPRLQLLARPGTRISTYLTGPSSPSFAFVASSKGVEASTHTSPLLSFTAVDRPPTGKRLNRENGLPNAHSFLSLVLTGRVYLRGLPGEYPYILRNLNSTCLQTLLPSNVSIAAARTSRMAILDLVVMARMEGRVRRKQYLGGPRAASIDLWLGRKRGV